MTAQKNGITQGVIWKEMLRFFMPIMVGTLLQQLYNTIDCMILSYFVGKQALAAVGGSDQAIIWLIVNAFVALSSGAGVVISQHYGAKDHGRLTRGVHTAIWLGVICGGIMTVLGVVFAPMMLEALKTPADTMEYSVQYLQWYFAGMIPAMIYNMGSGILRAVGDSRRPLYYLMACTGVNVVLDLLFVAVFRWEVVGAALATTLAQVVCAVLVMRRLLCCDDVYRVEPSKLRVDKGELGHMLRIGLPAAVQSSMYNICNVLIQTAINSMGTDHVAAWSAFWKLEGVYWPVCNAIGIGVMTFVGQNYGAGKRGRIKESIRTGLLLHLAFSVVYSAILLLGRYLWVNLFAQGDVAVLQSGVEIVQYMAPFYLFFSFIEVISAAMRGVGKSASSAAITLVGICLLRMVLLKFVVFPHTSNFTVAMCYPITWGVTATMYGVYHLCSRWVDKIPCEEPPVLYEE